ncbi:MAG: hypothetical protein RR743_06720 [Oscillospiraceae bacterium]
MKLATTTISAIYLMSLPSRGAWIEIIDGTGVSTGINVAPLTGSVD